VRFGVASGNLSELFNGASKVWQYGGSLGNAHLYGRAAGRSGAGGRGAADSRRCFAYQKAIQDAFRGVNDALIDQDRTRCSWPRSASRWSR
jgi:hypothetical protein